jgi:uncharacterized membrane protein
MTKEWPIYASEQATIIIDWLALLIILYGTIEASLSIVAAAFSPADNYKKREIWLRYARWLVAGLTFQLAADIIETSITTQWESVGRLAAVAVIRTFLNTFLDRDVAEVRARQQKAVTAEEGLPGRPRSEAA